MSTYFGIPEENVHYDSAMPPDTMLIYSSVVTGMGDFWDDTPLFYETEQATGITFYDEDFAWPWSEEEVSPW